MEYRCANRDRISHLPSEIIEKILMLLPCRDAVRTSILSSDWRYKWTSMSDLNFGEAWGAAYKHANFITQCLLRHQGPIRKFSVIARKLTVARKIEQWIKLVSAHDIEELQVDSRHSSFGSSSCLFNCKKLTHLKLFDCFLDVPPTFEGFMNLKLLTLSNVKVEDKSSIETLISKSPLLERIVLCQISCKNITISAPNVKYLIVRSSLEDICLKNLPSLVDLSLRLYGCDLGKILCDASNLFICKKLTHLDLYSHMLTIPPTFEGFMNLKALELSIGVIDKSSIETLISKSPLLESLIFDTRDTNIPITIYGPKIKYLSMKGNLKSIGLERSPVVVDMRLYLDGDSRDCHLINILGCAPNLQKLAVDLGWQVTERFKFGCNRGVLSTTFSYLKVMTLSEFYLGESRGIPLVIELLASAPNLEKLVIKNKSHSLPNEADSDFWQKEFRVGHCFMKLKVVEMGDILCMPPEIEFVKFILSNSPILEKMTICTRQRKQAITPILKKLPKLPLASPQVVVTLMTETVHGENPTAVWTNCSVES